jgi:hypothetical protein
MEDPRAVPWWRFAPKRVFPQRGPQPKGLSPERSHQERLFPHRGPTGSVVLPRGVQLRRTFSPEGSQVEFTPKRVFGVFAEDDFAVHL